LKAIVLREFGPPEVLKLEDIPTPVPGPGEILVKVHAVSVNVTLDIAVRKGVYARKPPFPHVLGCDPTGEVAALGAGVSRREVGERVSVHAVTRSPRCTPGHEADDPSFGAIIGVNRWGGYAEYAVVPAENAFTLPPALSFPEAAVIMRHMPTARHQLHCRAGLKAGEWVLVMGAAGGLASCCIQVAKRMGATVIGAAGSDEHVATAIAFGADHGINYRAQDLAAEVMKLTGGEGVHVVTENVGDPDLWTGAVNSLRPLGRLVTAGAHAGGKVALDLRTLYLKRLRLIGDPLCDFPDIEWALKEAQDGSVRPPVIAKILPLSEAAEAHRLIEARAVSGKVLLDPTRT
jgi:NADPH:quinone reductase-like Zn-dependent oxidoreductase